MLTPPFELEELTTFPVPVGPIELADVGGGREEDLEEEI